MDSATVVDELEITREAIEQRVRELGDWFHNLDLRGVRTAPNHFLGDYPATKWRTFADRLTPDLTGKTVLDIGCNAGFYSIEMKRRGAERVVAIDCDETYLAQAQFAAKVCEADIEFHQLSVYDVAKLGEKFDVVLFLGVFYHLRHPLLALDLIHEHVARDRFVFQSMQRGREFIDRVNKDYHFWQTDHFDSPGYPKMHFIEHRYADDPTNWWAPNRACSEAILRSAGFEILEHPESEVFICRWTELEDRPHVVYPAQS
jgi:tRNA (mo5U34)-methyltransferase